MKHTAHNRTLSEYAPEPRPWVSDHHTGIEELEKRQLLTAFPINPAHTMVELQTTLGNIRIELFDTVTPITTANFMRYVESDRYDGSFFHRAAAGFVLQGGGYSYTDEDGVDDVPDYGPIQNEFNRSNLARTLAMAKLGGDPNSATSEFFFSIADNSGNLDNQNGGFTVFAQVVDDESWAVVQSIMGLRIINAGGAFNNLPVTEAFEVGGTINESHLVYINDVVVVRTPEGTLQALLNAVPNVAAGPGGSAVVGVLNENGQTTLYQLSNGGGVWRAIDPDRASSITPTHNVITWRDPKDNRFYASVPTADGLLLYTNLAPGVWTTRNLTTEITGAEVITSEITSWKTTAQLNNVFRVVGITSDGDVVQYEQTVLGNGSGGYRWRFINLSNDLESLGLTTPTFTGRLVAYTTAWNAWHIAGLDADGKIQTIWRAQHMAKWVLSDLSAITGAPALSGGLTVYLTPWKGINLAGVDAQGNLQVTWWVPQFVGVWVASNLTDSISAPAIDGDSISSFNTPAGGLNIAARTADDRIIVFWWVPGAPENKWRVQNVSDAVTNVSTVIIPDGELSATASGDGVTSIVGRGPDGKVVRFYGSVVGGTWLMQDLTDLSVLV
jgi:cyclophilin family peptidyl-prolyl cis-trans isomerase